MAREKAAAEVNVHSTAFGGELIRAGSIGLRQVLAYLNGDGETTDDTRLRARIGLGLVAAAVRHESAVTNRMAVELARERYDAMHTLPASRVA